MASDDPEVGDLKYKGAGFPICHPACCFRENPDDKVKGRGCSQVGGLMLACHPLVSPAAYAMAPYHCQGTGWIMPSMAVLFHLTGWIASLVMSWMNTADLQNIKDQYTALYGSSTVVSEKSELAAAEHAALLSTTSSALMTVGIFGVLSLLLWINCARLLSNPVTTNSSVKFASYLGYYNPEINRSKDHRASLISAINISTRVQKLTGAANFLVPFVIAPVEVTIVMDIVLYITYISPLALRQASSASPLVPVSGFSDTPNAWIYRFIFMLSCKLWVLAILRNNMRLITNNHDPYAENNAGMPPEEDYPVANKLSQEMVKKYGSENPPPQGSAAAFTAAAAAGSRAPGGFAPGSRAVLPATSKEVAYTRMVR